MKFSIWFLSSTILTLTVCLYPLPLMADEESQILASINNIEARLSERQANILYLETRLADTRTNKDAASLYKEVSFRKDSVLTDVNLTSHQKAELLIRITRALINLGKCEESLQVCEDFLRECPENKQEASGLFCLVGSYSQELEKYPLAIEAYERAKEVVAGDTKGAFLAPEVGLDLGFCYYKGEEYEKALKEYNRAIVRETAVDTKSLQWTLLQIGRCNYFLKDYSQAKDFFQRVVRVNPDTALARQAKVNIEDMERVNPKP